MISKVFILPIKFVLCYIINIHLLTPPFRYEKYPILPKRVLYCIITKTSSPTKSR